MVKKGLFHPHTLARPFAEKTTTQSFYAKDEQGVLGKEGKGITVQSFETHKEEKVSSFPEISESIENKKKSAK